jgi:hypothetical protein
MIHRVPMCALRFARNSLSGWKLASSEYFNFFSTKFFRDGRYLSQAISSNARTIHSELPTVWQKSKAHGGLEKNYGVHWGRKRH